MQLRYVLCIYALLLATFTPLLGQRSPLNVGLSFTPKQTTAIFSQTDQGKSTPQFGLNMQAIVGYQFSNRVHFESGISYSFNQLEIIDYSATLGCDFDGSTVDLFNSWFENSTQIHYLGIPLAMRYQLTTKENFPYLKLGYDFLFKLKERQSTTLVECGDNNLLLTESSPYVLKNTSGMLKFGLGFEWASGGHSKLFIEPEVGYSLIPIYDDKSILRTRDNNVRLLELGLRIGVTL